ncbi:hypothetical protein Ahy_A03g011234 [Arachis hypogaea]|uniref:F-box associated domain-containing protein n=1 Tax=Arachis hypogaea TaxID=3818 RepID=A0A445DQ41_ARAHY|nr:hypothetical protein Ahy_A03g011234 [Arachis hypogaea]
MSCGFGYDDVNGKYKFLAVVKTKYGHLVSNWRSLINSQQRDPDDNITIIPVIGVLRNCLSLCFDHKKTHWAVWLRNNQSWTQFAMIPHHPEITNRFGVASLRILYVSDDDVLVLEKGQNPGLFLYYLKDGRVAFPMIHSFSDDSVGMPMSEQIGPRTLLVYYPSLLSPIHL